MFSPQRILSGTVVALSVLAISVPCAFAMSLAGTPGLSGHHAAPGATAPAVYSRQDKQVVPPATPTEAPVAPVARAPRFAAPTSRFSLTDAAITAGAVIALMLLALGTGLAISRRRSPHRAALSH